MSNRQTRIWMAVAVSAIGALTATSLRSAGSDAYSGKEWAAPGGDWAATRYSTLSQVTAANVKQLGGAWVVDLPERQQSKAPMMVANGRMFVTTGQGYILALDPSTGKSLWTFQPEAAFSGNRGVGIGEGLLFAGLRDSSVMAISQETGKPVWTFKPPPEIPPQGISTAPAYGNGVVVAGVSSGDNFLRGRAMGIDAKTGKFLWNFEVVPGPGEPGHETWPKDSDIWKYGGGAIWTTPSVDAELGLVYLETGNAVPQWGGELRPGDNLYNDSVVALDLKTGKVRWHFQTVHHDMWEHDLSTPLVLYDADDRRADTQAARRDAHRRHHVHPRSGNGEAGAAGGRAPGQAGRVHEDVADAAVHGGRRPSGPGVHREEHDASRVRRGVLLRSGPFGHAEHPHAAHEHAAVADGVQPADRLPVRNGVREPRVGAARRDRLGVHPAAADAGSDPVWPDRGASTAAPTRSSGRNASPTQPARTGRVRRRRPATSSFISKRTAPSRRTTRRRATIRWQFQTGEVGLSSGAGPGGGPAVVYEHGASSMSRS